VCQPVPPASNCFLIGFSVYTFVVALILVRLTIPKDMYVDNDDFQKWMEKLLHKLNELGKDIRLLINTDEVFGDEEKLLDNQDLCLMLHISKRTLQRYRSEGLIHYITIGQKIYYKASDVRAFVESHGDYWDKKAFDKVIAKK
jgi:hypothetical protein